MISEEPIPEFLVQVNYEIPPMRGIASMYFDDNEADSDDLYEKALREFHPTAIIRGITRKVKPDVSYGK